MTSGVATRLQAEASERLAQIKAAQAAVTAAGAAPAWPSGEERCS